jgi:hypothetical protein
MYDACEITFQPKMSFKNVKNEDSSVARHVGVSEKKKRSPIDFVALELQLLIELLLLLQNYFRISAIA